MFSNSVDVFPGFMAVDEIHHDNGYAVIYQRCNGQGLGKYWCAKFFFNDNSKDNYNEMRGSTIDLEHMKEKALQVLEEHRFIMEDALIEYKMA